jgi:hypothetical protein
MQPSIHVGLSNYSDAPGISQIEDYIQRPLLLPEMTLLQSDDSLSIPRLINLEISGLRRPPRLDAINGDTQDGPAIASTPVLQCNSNHNG